MKKEEGCSKKLSQVYKTKPDYILLLVVMALVSIGILMVFSASPTMALRIGDSYYYLKRHLFAVVIGFAALYAGMKVDYTSFKPYSSHIIGCSIALLLAVVITPLGFGSLGASRWLNLGIISFQPAEVFKLALIIYLAKELASYSDKKAFNAFVVIFVSLLLILKEPDMGTSLVIASVAFSIYFLAGVNIKYIYSIFIAAATGALLLSRFSHYRWRRIMAFVNPWEDPQGIGYHIIQSFIAVGSGGLFGAGLGGSKQKFFYLPQNYTDFIFAIFCEEMGLIGAVGIALLFFIFVSRGMKIVRNAPDNYSLLVGGGIVAWIGFQALLNMCVVVGLVPATGIPLPFISFGGTALVVSLFATGILLNISQYKRVG
jgi:cell division protein FtsW